MRRTLFFWAAIYSLLVIYVSVVLSPNGFNFVARDPVEAWKTFLSLRFVANGSDQKADWMANLLMLVPFGALWTAALWSGKSAAKRLLVCLIVFACSVAFVAAVKYAQLFFPPRTVNLNYVLAQSLGCAIGISLAAAFEEYGVRLLHQPRADNPSIMRAIFVTYAVALLIFFLFPLDFASNIDDFEARLTDLSHTLLSWPGAGRSLSVRTTLMLANVLEAIPLGLLLVTERRSISVATASAVGFAAMAGVCLASMFVLGVHTYLVTIFYRGAGVFAGVLIGRQLSKLNIVKTRQHLARAAPLLWLTYLVLVALILRPFSMHWRTLEEARNAIDPRSLLPLWNYYVISKAQGMLSLVAHILIFAPVGILIWLRRDNGPASSALSVLIAITLALCIEFARAMTPGEKSDINNFIIAGFAAWVAVKTMPVIWQVVELSSRGGRVEVLDPAAYDGGPV